VVLMTKYKMMWVKHEDLGTKQDVNIDDVENDCAVPIIESVGFIIKENEKYLWLMTFVCDGERKADVFIIHKCVIIEMKELIFSETECYRCRETQGE